MIAKEPIDRYQSCHELAEDLAAHPLVAKGGPITLVPKVSAAAATMVGQRTPAHAQRPTPISVPAGMASANTRITPSAQPMPPTGLRSAPASAEPAFERRSVLESSDRAEARRSSPLVPVWQERQVPAFVPGRVGSASWWHSWQSGAVVVGEVPE